MKIQIQYYTTPVGELILGSFQEQLCLCDWRYREKRTIIDARIQKHLNSIFEEKTSSVIENASKQLHEYFNRKREEFTLPLLLCGTDFQKKVWNELREIPFGETNTYLELSKKIDSEKAIRAVASANGANALSILIPCHRVIGSNRELVGYAGGLKAKQQLLELESAWVQTSLF